MRELTWNAHGDRREPRRAHPGAHALRHRARPRRLRLRSSSRWAPRRRRARRLRGRPAPHDDPPARRRVPQGHLDLPDVGRDRGGHRDRRPRGGGQARRPRRRAQHPGALRFTEGQVAIEAGTGDDAQASEAVEATLTGPEIEIAFNPHLPARRAPCGGHAVQPPLLHPAEPPRGPLGSGRGRRRGRHLLPLRPHAGALRVLTRRGGCRGVAFARQRPTRRRTTHREEAPTCSSV